MKLSNALTMLFVAIVIVDNTGYARNLFQASTCNRSLELGLLRMVHQSAIQKNCVSAMLRM